MRIILTIALLLTFSANANQFTIGALSNYVVDNAAELSDNPGVTASWGTQINENWSVGVWGGHFGDLSEVDLDVFGNFQITDDWKFSTRLSYFNTNNEFFDALHNDSRFWYGNFFTGVRYFYLPEGDKGNFYLVGYQYKIDENFIITPMVQKPNIFGWEDPIGVVDLNYNLSNGWGLSLKATHNPNLEENKSLFRVGVVYSFW